MKSNKVKILDCTLRDGGYYNKWDFDHEIVASYLKAMAESSVDFVELGFRSLPQNLFLGPYAYSTDDFLNNLNLPEGPSYGVMINGKDFTRTSKYGHEAIDKLFRNKDESLISLVRVAINFNDALSTKEIIVNLKKKGYTVGLNLMQSHGKNDLDYFQISKEIYSWGIVDVLYFADSLGNMVPQDIINICFSLRKGWSGELGIHTHNNKSLALINTITAIDNQVTWCDSTITGMGRGAGNVPTENLMLELMDQKYDVIKLESTVEAFNLMKNKYNWGSSLYYHYAANSNIHPTFVQSLLEDKRYDNKQILSALKFLSNKNSTSFSTSAIREAIYGNQLHSDGKWDATGWLKNKEVLIVGSGPSVDRYNIGILEYIKKTNPEVLFLNINKYLPSKIGKATIVCNETRTLFDASNYNSLNHPIILPEKRLDILLKKDLKNVQTLDYALNLKEDCFDIRASGCTLEWPLAAAYALAIITVAGAKKISLVGFDGYNADDIRQEEMNDVFFNYKLLKNSIEIQSLTPTSYRVNQHSLFSII